MSIKDRAAIELIQKLRQVADDTVADGNERGFELCEDKKGKIYPGDKICEGDECSITMLSPGKSCGKNKPIGTFHTHAYISMYLEEYQNRFDKFPSSNELENFIKDDIRRIHKERGVDNMSVNAPSPTDFFSAIIEACKYKGTGTVCTTSDVIPYEVECWSPKVDLSKDIYKRYCSKAKRQHGEELVDYKKSSEAWAVKLFNKEIINLINKRNK